MSGVDAGELVAALLGRDGVGAVTRIAGAFAFVLWDPPRTSLLLVRDRLGTRGLYWCETGRRVLVADDPKKLVVELGTIPVPEPRALAGHLACAALPEGGTWFRGIQAVMPGEMLAISATEVTRHRYWRVELPRTVRPRSDAEYAEAFWSVFSTAVKGAMGSGATAVTLSSGLDSTAVAAAVAEAGGRGIALHWSAPELAEADEAPLAHCTSRALGWEAFDVRADQRWPLSSPAALEVPSLGPPLSFYGEIWSETFAATKRAGASCLLTGFSGDHLFGGDVFPYADLLLAGRWRRFLGELRAHREVSSLSLPRLLRHMVLSPLAGWARGPRPRTAASLPAWLTPRARDLVLGAETASAIAPPADDGPALPRWLPPGRAERLRALRDPLLPRIAEDVTARAAREGVDLRHPWLDHRLFELAAALPSDQSFEGGERKRVVRRALRGRAPGELLDRRGKIYPYAIARRGLAEREVSKVLGLLTDMRLAAMGLVNESLLRAAYDNYRRDDAASSVFWHALMLEAWVRRHLPPSAIVPV